MTVTVLGPGNVDMVELVRRSKSDIPEVAQAAEAELRKLTVAYKGGTNTRSSARESR